MLTFTRLLRLPFPPSVRHKLQISTTQHEQRDNYKIQALTICYYTPCQRHCTHPDVLLYM